MIVDKHSPVPQYFQLQTWLMEQIDQGVFKSSDKIPTEEELVQMTGLARATIRQAVQNLVHMGYLERKKRLGTFVLDRHAEVEKKTMVGILIPDIRRGYAPELARGAEDEAAKSRHSLILCNTDDLYAKAEFHADRLIDNNVTGVIFVPSATSDVLNQQLIDKFLRRNISVVLTDRIIPDTEIDYVTTDNFDAAYQLTNYLITMGHNRIAITLSTLFSTERERLRGYKQALQDNDLAVEPSLIFVTHDPFNEQRYYVKAKSILQDRNNFSAVFAGHDRIALQFYRAALDLGIGIPDDISVVGFDDLDFTTIPLTTMHQPIYEMGVESMKLILSKIKGDSSAPRGIELKSYLVERLSVKKICK